MAAALALLLGAPAGVAQAITYTSTVRESPSGAEANADEYIIKPTSGFGVSTSSNEITIGGTNTQTISITSASRGIYSVSSNTGSPSVTLQSQDSTTVSGREYGIYAQSTHDGQTSTVTLQTDGANTVNATGSGASGAGIQSVVQGGDARDSSVSLMAGTANEVASSGGYGILSAAYSGANSTSEVILKAGESNTISATGYTYAYGIYSVAEETGNSSTVALEAGNNQVTGNYRGMVAESRDSAESTITLTATGGSNTVEAVNGLALSSYAHGSGSTQVALEADEDNIITGSTYALAVESSSDTASSAVTLSAGGTNRLTATSGTGIYAAGSEVQLQATGSNVLTAAGGTGINAAGSTVELTVRENNQINSRDWSVYASQSNVTLSAGGKNILTSDYDSACAVLYASDGTIEVTGETELAGYAGAESQNGGSITFNDAVTADASIVATVGSTGGSVTFRDQVTTNGSIAALAYGADSTVTFEEGLSNVGYVSRIISYDDALVDVNTSGAGIVTFTGTTSLSGGTTQGRVNLNLTDSASYWHMTGSSAATALGLSGGALLDMTHDGNAFSTLTVNTLSGQGGTIHMDVDAATNTNNSDRLYVGTHSGEHYITLNSVGTDTDGAAGTVVVSVGDEQGTFKANDSEGPLYWNRYTLDQQASTTSGYNTDWYIAEAEIIDEGDTPLETTTVGTALAATSLNYNTWMVQNTKLLQRLGDLRQGANSGDNGAWFRISGSKLSSSGQHGFRNKYAQYEAGYDKIIGQTDRSTRYGGIALSYSNGDSAYQSGSGDNESKAVSLYFTQIQDSGSYLDVVLKVGRWDNDFHVYDTTGNRISGETANTGLSLGAEYGRKLSMGETGLYIEPQAQLTYGHLFGDDYTLSNGVRVHAEGIDSLVGRAGFNLGYNINPRANLYLKASVLHEFLGDYGVTLTDPSGRLHRSGDYGDTWFLYGLGGAFELGRPGSGNFLYFDVEKTTGGDLDQDWFYNVGFRFEV